MKQTKLVEFQANDSLLRGILVTPDKRRVPENFALFLHGFERVATSEKKFKVFADKLAVAGVASFRFDFSGCGLSEGDFSVTTVARRSFECAAALAALEEKSFAKPVAVVAHSLGAAVLVKLLESKPEITPTALVLLAPALNQKELLRYWFVQSFLSKQNPETSAEWGNYRDYLDEKEFQADCRRETRMTAVNHIGREYYLENKEVCYRISPAASNDRTLWIHGDADTKVPRESVQEAFIHAITVRGGNHDLERPDVFEQWIDRAVDFVAQRT